MQVRDIMTPNPSVVVKDETMGHAAVLMQSRRIGVLPVVDDLRSKRLVGVVTDRDIATRGVARNKGPGTKVGDVMSSHHLAVTHVDESPSDVLRLMNTRHLRRVPVLDARERVVGIITMADLLSRHGSPMSLGLDADFEWAEAAAAR